MKISNQLMLTSYFLDITNLNDIDHTHKTCIVLSISICETLRLHSISDYCVIHKSSKRSLGGCWILTHFLNLFICFKGAGINNQLVLHFITKLQKKMQEWNFCYVSFSFSSEDRKTKKRMKHLFSMIPIIFYQ